MRKFIMSLLLITGLFFTFSTSSLEFVPSKLISNYHGDYGG